MPPHRAGIAHCLEIGACVASNTRLHSWFGSVSFRPITDIGLDSSGPPAFAFKPRSGFRCATYGERVSGNDVEPEAALTSAGRQITVEDVRGGFPIAADLPPDDHVFAGVGLWGAVGRNR